MNNSIKSNDITVSLEEGADYQQELVQLWSIFYDQTQEEEFSN